MPNLITNEELKDLHISRALFNQWEKIMQSLWKMCRTEFKETQQGENCIVIGKCTVEASFINHAYIEIKVIVAEEDMLTIRFADNMPAIITCINEIVKVSK